MLRSAVSLWNFNRALLAIYLIALLGLLMIPFSGPENDLFGIETDKLVHVVLFAGLAMLLRLNLTAKQHAVMLSIAAAFVVVVATEAAQGLVKYRSAELMDVLAGFLGATLGAVGMNRIVSSPVFEKWVGVLVIILGLMVGALFLLADVIGVGDRSVFGLVQMAGMALGAVMAARGFAIYMKGSRGQSRAS